MKEINFKEILTAKDPKAAKKIPCFVYKIINKVLHIKQINAFIREYGDREGVEFASALIHDSLKVNVVLTGFENLPETGRIIVAANHPLGGLDGVAIIEAVAQKRPDIIFPVNDFLTYIPNLKSIFIPINKVGKTSRDAIKLLEDTFKSDKTILYFPAGLCSRKIKGKIQDLEWKKTFIKQAVQTQRDIVPVYVNGVNSKLFYNVERFRRFLGIKFNIGMALLPRELFNKAGKTIELVFGKPIPWQTFDTSKAQTQWTQCVRNYVYSLRKNPNVIFKSEKYGHNKSCCE